METNRVQRIRRGGRIVPGASRQPALLLCQPSQGRVLLPWMRTGGGCGRAGGTAPRAELPESDGHTHGAGGGKRRTSLERCSRLLPASAPAQPRGPELFAQPGDLVPGGGGPDAAGAYVG